MVRIILIILDLSSEIKQILMVYALYGATIIEINMELEEIIGENEKEKKERCMRVPNPRLHV